MSKTLASFLLIFAIVSMSIFLLREMVLQNSSHDTEIPTRLSINGAEIEIELADTLEKRVRGLSGRDKLLKNQGMLFIFDKPNFHSIWMKDMRFALDIIWIDEEWRVIDITKNALPESFPQTFRPISPAKYILEVNAGFTEKNRIRIGNQVERSK
ncbi:DUF192 domain-containing protein, partial [Patescibacteria group bacterium]|nr:DUF192 domain-containing protein [Patescibacteria group bacterium]